MATATLTREHLIKNVWPDKVMYGSIMLLVTGALGLLHGLVDLAFGVTYSSRLPATIRDYPPLLTVAFSAAALALAFMALRERRTWWAMLGCASGVLSLGLIGIASLLSLAAFGFVVASRKEGEDTTPETLELDPDLWPDKSLAASMLLFVSGVVTGVWGLAILAGSVEWSTSPSVFGPLGVIAGVASLAAARGLYYQRGPLLGLAAATGGVLALGLYVIGPLLSIAAIVLIALAMREDEFER